VIDLEKNAFAIASKTWSVSSQDKDLDIILVYT